MSAVPVQLPNRGSHEAGRPKLRVVRPGEMPAQNMEVRSRQSVEVRRAAIRPTSNVMRASGRHAFSAEELWPKAAGRPVSAKWSMQDSVTSLFLFSAGAVGLAASVFLAAAFGM